MMRLFAMTRKLLLLLLLVCVVERVATQRMTMHAEDYLEMGDKMMSESGEYEQAIQYYKDGIEALTDDESPLTILSLHTNLATAFSSVGKEEEAMEEYQIAIAEYTNEIEDVVDKDMKAFMTEIAASASFFLGMVLQDLGEIQKAVDAYGYAINLDPMNWAAVANLASIFHDQMNNHEEALIAYNRAYEILTQTEDDITDPPADPSFILSEIQYRIGLCLIHDPSRKCAVEGDPEAMVSCKEMATHAFSLAVKFNPENESAKHMLATVTADATMKRASNLYVEKLFDDYAQNFEHSLVQELGYTGYERLRRGFDRSFGGQDKVPSFSLVIDAGCGTGLVGEQFRNVSDHLVGVDLSAAILNEAEKKRPGLYDEKIVGDITEVFVAKRPVDLIVAADSYIYFGDLVPLFEAMETGLGNGGYAAFTLENVAEDSEKSLSESKPEWRWQLTASGRFAHRKEYVAGLSEHVGLRVVHYESLDGFRFEQGKEVRGHLFVVQKTGEKTKDEL